jgi:DNA-binding CsgD family transcriptional regulator
VGDTTGAAGAFERRDWAEAHRLLSCIPGDQRTAADLDRLAVAAYLLGRDDEAARAWEAAHKRHLQEGDRAEAARCAFWVAFSSMMQGRMAHAGGWLGRCEAAIGDDLDCSASGYLLVPALLGALDADDAQRARDLAVEAGRIAARFADPDLAAFSSLGHGQALLALGDERGGLARLDEVMLSVTSDEVGPIVSGVVYCAVILECMQLYDLARAAEWTAALDAWCSTQPDLVPYRGQCLVHQSQLQQAEGEWSLAAATAEVARARLTDPPHPALGLACYQQGELHRLRGELAEAADAYGRASQSGYQPMPGLALLELARGDAAAATASIRRALAEANQPFQRPGLLAAAVEILVAAGDVAGAREAADELATISGRSRSEFLAALSEHASGAVSLAEGAVTGALVHLRSAGEAWRRLRMPYEAARVAILLGQGCRALGDRTSASLEFDNAGEALRVLGARTELDRLRVLTGGEEPRREALSARELDVLARVASGRTNKEIAGELSISQHTVGRHLENIFAKLGVSTRAAATAYAYEHGLL